VMELLRKRKLPRRAAALPRCAILLCLAAGVAVIGSRPP
jgi:hypothetical protein